MAKVTQSLTKLNIRELILLLHFSLTFHFTRKYSNNSILDFNLLSLALAA